LSAQTYSSNKLLELGEEFPKTCLPLTDSIFNCPQVIKGKSFVVQYNSKNEVEHLGVSLFSPETKAMLNVPICNFIERIMLELLLQKNNGNVNKKLQEYKIKIHEHGLISSNTISNISQIIYNMQEPVKFSISHDSLLYEARWMFENEKWLMLHFPATRELIFGTNKKESDQELNESLSQKNCNEKEKPNLQLSGEDVALIPYKEDIFEKQENNYMLPQLNRNTYYVQNEGNVFFPLVDRKYPELSLKNMLLISGIETDLRLCVKHKMYGNFTPEFEISLSDFICFFESEFETYCHAEMKDNKLKATIILYNKHYNYIHLFIIQTTPETVFQSNGILNAEFYSNIPQHNIKSLF
jgi:hypothetical protein